MTNSIQILGIGGFVFEQLFKLITSSPALMVICGIIALIFAWVIYSFVNKGFNFISWIKRVSTSLLDFVIDHPVICAILAFLLFIYIKSR